jgi:hypothetical protein
MLQNISKGAITGYAGYLTGKITGELLKSEDHYDLAEHMKPRMEAAGWYHDDDPLTKEHADLVKEYIAGIIGNSEKLEEAGYKYKKPEPKKK